MTETDSGSTDLGGGVMDGREANWATRDGDLNLHNQVGAHGPTRDEIEAYGAQRMAQRCWIGSESAMRWTKNWRNRLPPPPGTRVPPYPYPLRPRLPENILTTVLRPSSTPAKISSPRVPCCFLFLLGCCGFNLFPAFFIFFLEKALALVKNELVPDGREGEDEKGTKKQF